MRRTAAGPLRSGPPARELVARQLRYPRREFHVALCARPCPFSTKIPLSHSGEGMTPLLPARRTGARIGATDLLIKDEGLNPTGSFKARGLSCAVSMCVELGSRRLAIPSAGNAASALAAYAAAAGIEAHIFMPPTFRRPISSNARPTARTSRWSTA